MESDGDERKWGKAYAVVLAALVLTVVALTILSRASW
jgi:hypothetical protein